MTQEELDKAVQDELKKIAEQVAKDNEAHDKEVLAEVEAQEKVLAEEEAKLKEEENKFLEEQAKLEKEIEEEAAKEEAKVKAELEAQEKALEEELKKLGEEEIIIEEDENDTEAGSEVDKLLYKELKDAITKYGFDVEKVGKTKGVTVGKTKVVLTQLGLSTKGKEAELLARLFEHIQKLK